MRWTTQADDNTTATAVNGARSPRLRAKGELVRHGIAIRDRDLATAAREMRMARNTLTAVVRGQPVSRATLLKVAHWLKTTEPNAELAAILQPGPAET